MGIVACARELDVKAVRKTCLAQQAVEPACRGCDRLLLGWSEIVAGSRDRHEVDPGVPAGGAFEDGERPELVVLSLDDEGRAPDGGEPRPRPGAGAGWRPGRV